MSNTGIKGISIDTLQGKQRFQIQITTCGKRFYKAFMEQDYDIGMLRAQIILKEFQEAAPCVACGEVVTNLIDGECVGCRG